MNKVGNVFVDDLISFLQNYHINILKHQEERLLQNPRKKSIVRSILGRFCVICGFYRIFIGIKTLFDTYIYTPSCTIISSAHLKV